MKNFLISICIPAYNASKFISETLDSIKLQTYKNWELIVVEDGSRDGTEVLVENFRNQAEQKVTYLRNNKNLGLPATRNVASRASRGEWIAYIDSDDLWHPNHLAGLMSTAINCPHCDLIHSGVELFESKTGHTISQRIPSPEAIQEFPLSLFKRTYPVQPSSIMVSRQLFQKTGGFNESFKYTEDLEMWFRCAKMGYQFAYSATNTCFYRIHSEAMTTHSLELTFGTAKAYDLYADWEIIPKKLRTQYAADHWLSAARIARKNNSLLAMECLMNSIKHRLTFKHLFFWILIKTSVFRTKKIS